MACKNTAAFGIYSNRAGVENTVETLISEGFWSEDIPFCSLIMRVQKTSLMRLVESCCRYIATIRIGRIRPSRFWSGPARKMFRPQAKSRWMREHTPIQRQNRPPRVHGCFKVRNLFTGSPKRRCSTNLTKGLETWLANKTHMTTNRAM